MRRGALAALFLLLPSAMPPAQEEAAAAAAQARIKAGDPDGALRLLEEALKAAPRSALLHTVAAQALYLRARRIALDPRLSQTVQEEMAAAEEEARAALAADPAARDARMVLAQALYHQGRLEEAAEEAGQVLAAAAGDGGAHFLLGEITFVRSDQAVRAGEVQRGAELRQAAGEHYRQALAQKAREAACWHRLGNLEAQEGRLAEALKNYARALRLDPAEAPHEWLLSLASRGGEGVDRGALAGLYREAAKARREGGDAPGAASLLARLGLHLEQSREWAPAREAARAALRLDPEGQWSAAYRAGWCSYWLQDEREAERSFLEIARTRRVPFCDLLAGLGAEGRAAAAMMHALSATAVAQGRQEDARDLSLLLAVLRNSGTDWNNYAFLCRETGRYEEAWKGYNRALERAPAEPRYLNDAGLILHFHLKRDLELARDLYNRAVAEADRILSDPGARAEAKAQAAEAKRDAQNNLRLLGRQDGKEPQGPVSSRGSRLP